MQDVTDRPAALGAAEMTALAHVYRAEVYRGAFWRGRLDATTNWAVVTTGLALSLAFAAPDAAALPLALVGPLVAVFLAIEASRYRHYGVWRARARMLETAVWSPMLRGGAPEAGRDWALRLADDYAAPRFHVSLGRALGRRLRKAYGALFLFQAAAFAFKLTLHPEPAVNLGQMVERAAVGPASGGLVLALAAAFHAGWVAVAVASWVADRRERRLKGSSVAIG
jgi:uncharacterized membrane protein